MVPLFLEQLLLVVIRVECGQNWWVAFGFLFRYKTPSLQDILLPTHEPQSATHSTHQCQRVLVFAGWETHNYNILRQTCPVYAIQFEFQLIHSCRQFMVLCVQIADALLNL
uniref:(northern house mosquito) hypothetical protein n=1 Tax=Culex pipiens TaxID=7175 RepID=A0A8D8G8U3_CULPI